MKAVLLAKARVVYAQDAFAELVLWRLPAPLRGSQHDFKYRLAYVVAGVCVIRYDNEAGKGDHRHAADDETVYKFITPEALMDDFERDINRWNHENGRS